MTKPCAKVRTVLVFEGEEIELGNRFVVLNPLKCGRCSRQATKTWAIRRFSERRGAVISHAHRCDAHPPRNGDHWLPISVSPPAGRGPSESGTKTEGGDAR